MSEQKIPSNQEVFDRVARHLLTQMRQSWDHEQQCCAYRGSRDTRCAAGVLIPNSLYERNMEGKYWEELCLDYPLLRNVRNPVLIRDLQSIHDDVGVERWAPSLRKLADRLKLSAAVIDETSASQ